LADLSPFANTTLELRWYFKARQIGPFGDVSTGWYIDDISVLSGTMGFQNPEGWESGIGDWYVDGGLWEVGRPTSGPNGAYRGVNCAATVLAGNYCEPTATRLMSSFFRDTSASTRLTFWQWYSLANGDTGRVQIRTHSSGWRTLDSIIGSGGGIWSQPNVSLSAYRDSVIQIAFYFSSRQIGPFGDVGSGWYIDSVHVLPGVVYTQEMGELPLHFTLSQNYPNPFNPETKIKFQIPTSSDVVLQVFDVLGREVKTLVNERLQPGSYETTFDGKDLSSGVYLYRLQAGGFVETKKLLLLR